MVSEDAAVSIDGPILCATRDSGGFLDVFEKCRSYTVVKDALAAGLPYPYFIPLTESEGSEAVCRGQRMIMCGSNNYLGLTTHPRVRQAAIDAISRCTGSRFLNGTLEMHEELEAALAEFVGKEEALVFSTGMQANLGVISSLVGRHDVVVLDKDDHASIVDGAHLAWGETKRFRHSDVRDLERVLDEARNGLGILVVVDGLFSMGGDIAPLPDIVELARDHGARVMVDDAHAMGVLGGGRGTAAHFGLTDEVDLIMSTFSKSFASLGGFIAGDADVIHFVKHTARSLIFSASIPPANAAAALAALEVMRTEPERIQRVVEIGDHMRREYRRMGFDIGNTASPIIPIVIGDDERTFTVWKALFDNGVFVNPVLSPAVPEGHQLLRTSYMATHTDEQLERVLDTFERVGKAAGLIG
jgi:8-amino-7-oxononanoate synthase